MKQLLRLSLLILLSVVSIHSYATKMDDVEIDLENKNEGTNPRSVVIVPQAWFSSQTSTVKLQISSRDGYAVVTIKDNTGIEICSQSVIANGTIQQILMPNYLSTDAYRIYIQCNGTEYSGQFSLS